MKCSNCKITVRSYYAFCPNCGADLKANQKRIPKVIAFVLVVFLLVAGGIYFYLNRSNFQTIHNIDVKVKNASDKTGYKIPFSNLLYSIPQPDTPQINLSVGKVIIKDIAGNQLAAAAGVVSDSGWVAIPAKLCVGGVDWRFCTANGEDSEIIGGIIGDADDVGIWQLKAINQFPGRQLSPAKLEKPLTWVSIVSEQQTQPVKLSILSEQQNLYHILLPESIQNPGVLIQDDKIVGWTFGDLLDGGYLWRGPDETDLVYELGVSDFYRLTFENSREEQFIIAYSSSDATPVKQLEKFANGFRLDSMLSYHNMPSHLRSGAVVSKMRSIISQLTYNGDIEAVAEIFDSTILSAAGDVSLLTDVLNIVKDIRGQGDAVDMSEKILSEPDNFNDRQIDQIKAFLKKRYVQWLTILMHDKDYSKGIDVFNRAQRFFGNEPEIQLMGARLALSFNDWRAAERLLSTYAFPADLIHQVDILQEKISDLKHQEDKIIVRFSPGSAQIPVTAFLNNKTFQNFVVDTGASTITIPTATAEKLGLNRDGTAPVQKLVTAGGVVEAPVVTIDSVELGGWIEYNVTAFILDLPNKSGLGLLGLNYLHRFRMDLNTKSGLLVLEPR